MSTRPSEQDAVDRLPQMAELERLRDLSEHLLAENEYLMESQRVLQETRDHYADLYDFAPLAWLTLDGDGCVDSVNRQALDLLSRDRRQLLGVPMAALVLGRDRRTFQEHLRACALVGPPASCELTLSGAESPVPVRLVSRQASRGALKYVVALIDLREREQAAMEHRQLSEGAREARAANDAKDQFIAVLSHELRTPLTPVLATVSALLMDEETPAHLRATFEMLHRNVNAEARLIDDLLDVTRIARNKMSVERRPMNAHSTVLESIETVRSELDRKHHELLVELDAQASWIQGDPARLRQVFCNLLRNAVKFTPEGGRIEIHSWNRDDQLSIEVRDTGRGIDAEAMARLFAPFEQGVDETSAALGGLGLGLAICRGIVDLHEGQVVAHSQGRNQGSRFVVDLATIDPPEHAACARPSSAPPMTRKLRILLVDDHADTLEVMSMLLSHAGHAVRTATSLASARGIDPTSLDLVISDIGLGDGTGIELLQHVRKQSQVKAIALSGYGTETDRRASTQAGFSAHVTKPVDFDQLLEVIARVSR